MTKNQVMTKSYKIVSLRKKLLIAVLISSSILTTVLTAISVYVDYLSEVKSQQESISIIESSFLSPMALSMWNLDREQLRVQIEGILASSIVAKVDVFDIEGKLFFSQSKNKEFESIRLLSYPLKYESPVGAGTIGEVHLMISDDAIIRTIRSRILSTFLISSVKTILISFVLMSIFRVLVTGHLMRINEFLRNHNIFSGAGDELVLYRRDPRSPDEIDQLVETINHIGVNARKNIQQIKDLRLKAEESSRVKSTFLTNMSHELRTPLNSIIGVNDILLQMTQEGELRNYINIQKKNSSYLLSLTNDVLDFSKLEAGEVQINKVPFSIKAELDELFKVIKGYLALNSNSFISEVSPEIPETVEGDNQRLIQVLLNILLNANKFTKNGVIKLKVESTLDGVRFIVSDSGVGIPASILKDIFEPFKQAEEGPTRSFSGVGIGLTISREIVRLMGGDIRITSEVGKGTTVDLTIPFKVSSEAVQRITADTLDFTRLSKRKLLIVEDQPENRLVIKGYLKRCPYELVFADNGEIGLEKFKTDKFDVVFMDLQMPVMNGFESTRLMREFEKNERKSQPPTPIVALTAYTSKSDIDKAIEAGCNDYIAKPVGRMDLINYIESIDPIALTSGLGGKRTA